MEKKYDIYDRIYKSIVETIKVTNMLTRTASNQVIVNQLLRSATSMGANSQEADGTITKKDFIYCFTTVRKEGKETCFWLQLLGDTNSVNVKEAVSPLLKEGKEITAIVSKIINNTRNNTKHTI